MVGAACARPIPKRETLTLIRLLETRFLKGRRVMNLRGYVAKAAGGFSPASTWGAGGQRGRRVHERQRMYGEVAGHCGGNGEEKSRRRCAGEVGGRGRHGIAALVEES